MKNSRTLQLLSDHTLFFTDVWVHIPPYLPTSGHVLRVYSHGWLFVWWKVAVGVVLSNPLLDLKNSSMGDWSPKNSREKTLRFSTIFYNSTSTALFWIGGVTGWMESIVLMELEGLKTMGNLVTLGLSAKMLRWTWCTWTLAGGSSSSRRFSSI